MIGHYLSSNNEMCYNIKTQIFSRTKHIIRCLSAFIQSTNGASSSFMFNSRPFLLRYHGACLHNIIPLETSPPELTIVEIQEDCTSGGHSRRGGHPPGFDPSLGRINRVWHSRSPRVLLVGKKNHLSITSFFSEACTLCILSSNPAQEVKIEDECLNKIQPKDKKISSRYAN